MKASYSSPIIRDEMVVQQKKYKTRLWTNKASGIFAEESHHSSRHPNSVYLFAPMPLNIESLNLWIDLFSKKVH
jgi:hypothetical protein